MRKQFIRVSLRNRVLPIKFILLAVVFSLKKIHTYMLEFWRSVWGRGSSAIYKSNLEVLCKSCRKKGGVGWWSHPSIRPSTATLSVSSREHDAENNLEDLGSDRHRHRQQRRPRHPVVSRPFSIKPAGLATFHYDNKIYRIWGLDDRKRERDDITTPKMPDVAARLSWGSRPCHGRDMRSNGEGGSNQRLAFCMRIRWETDRCE